MYDARSQWLCGVGELALTDLVDADDDCDDCMARRTPQYRPIASRVGRPVLPGE